MGLYFLILGYYVFEGKVQIQWGIIYLLPVLVLLMAFLGLGLGMFISALTTKYRDLTFLLSFGIQLGMYITPIVYPYSMVPEKLRWVVDANPCTGVIETFRFMFTGSGSFMPGSLLYALVFTLVINLIGLVIFNRTERSFIDTV